MSETTTSASCSDWRGEPAKPGDDLVYVFSGFRLDVEFRDGFEDAEKAREAFRKLAEEIWIDKTYVSFEGTKFKHTFLREEGWDELGKLVWKAKRGKAGAGWSIILRRAFDSMIVAYMEHVADIMGYDVSQIDFSVDPESDIKLWLMKDTAREWLTYRGPWQDWPENN